MPRDPWLEYWEKQAIAEYAQKQSLDGYWRLAFTMLDADSGRRQPQQRLRASSPAFRGRYQ